MLQDIPMKTNKYQNADNENLRMATINSQKQIKLSSAGRYQTIYL